MEANTHHKLARLRAVVPVLECRDRVPDDHLNLAQAQESYTCSSMCRQANDICCIENALGGEASWAVEVAAQALEPGERSLSPYQLVVPFHQAAARTT